MAKKVIILGAGIAGLAAGWFLKRRIPDIDLTILEKDSRPGGWIQTTHQEGFLFEKGPRSIRTKSLSPEAILLFESLDLKKDIILPHPDANQRFLYEGQKLKKMPGSLLKVPFSSLTRGWLKAFLNECCASKSFVEDESVGDFFARRLSPEWAERLIDPFISGIYAGDMHKLSMKSCFPFFYQLEQKHGSLIYGMLKQEKKTTKPFVEAPFFSFKNGMETLVHALKKDLEKELRLNCGIDALKVNNEGYQVQLSSGESLNADQVISALPAHVLASLLPDYSNQLNAINFSTVLVANLGYRKNILKQHGFGYLIPSKERESVLGCVWDSCVFPQQNGSEEETRLTVMMGGSRLPEVKEWSDEQGKAIALKALKKHLEIDAMPDVISLKRAYKAIPQYEIGYDVLKKGLEDGLGKLICIGNSFTGVSVTDAISGAYRATL